MAPTRDGYDLDRYASSHTAWLEKFLFSDPASLVPKLPTCSDLSGGLKNLREEHVPKRMGTRLDPARTSLLSNKSSRIAVASCSERN